MRGEDWGAPGVCLCITGALGWEVCGAPTRKITCGGQHKMKMEVPC